MGIFTENFMKMVNNNVSLSVVEEAQRYPENVRIYNGKDGKVYVPTVDLEQYMEAANITDLEEAMENIASVNPFISKDNMIITNNGCSETFLEHLVEESERIGGGVILEKAVEDEAMSVKQAKKYLDKLLSESKSKSDSKEDIKLKIQILKKCVRDMETQLKNPDKNFMQTKYVLKGMFIPFNALYRFLVKKDTYKGISILANLVVPGSGALVSAATYKSMLQMYIYRTKEAIEYLEKEYKKM